MTATRRDGTDAAATTSAARRTDDAMTRSEEELRVGTRAARAGRARLRKYVVTEEVQQTVPVQREEVRVEREPITDANVDAGDRRPRRSPRRSTPSRADRDRRRGRGAIAVSVTGDHRGDPQAGTAPRRRADYRPAGTDGKSSLFATVKRTFTEFSEDNLTDWAAALTYYGLLSLFPALIALVSILGLFGDPATTTKTITDIVTKIGPELGGRHLRGADQVDHRRTSGAAGFAVRRRPRRRAVVGLGLRRRLHARLERRSTRPPRAGRSGSCGRCRSSSRS